MDQLGNILPNKRFAEPPAVILIKQYIQEKYETTPTVTIRPQDIIITVPSAALAGSLRMELHQLQQHAQTDKRLSIRIGH